MDSSEDEAPVFKKNLRDPEDVGGSGTFASDQTGHVQDGGLSSLQNLVVHRHMLHNFLDTSDIPW